MKSINLSNELAYVVMEKLFILFVFFLFVIIYQLYLVEPHLSSRLSAFYVLGCQQR
jgi:hypothetical protein